MSGRKAPKVDASQLRPENIRAKREAAEKVKSSFEFIRKETKIGGSISEILAWSFLQAKPAIVLKAVQLLSDVGHLGL